PRPCAPPDLLDTLLADISLPQTTPARLKREQPKIWQNSLRRWLPAFGFGIFLLSCLVIVGVQSNLITQVKHRNQELRATASNLDQPRQDHDKVERLQKQQEDLEQLRKDHQDLVRLRAEVEQLRALTPELNRLRGENQRLSTMAARLKTRAVIPPASES